MTFSLTTTRWPSSSLSPGWSITSPSRASSTAVSGLPLQILCTFKECHLMSMCSLAQKICSHLLISFLLAISSSEWVPTVEARLSTTRGCLLLSVQLTGVACTRCILGLLQTGLLRIGGAVSTKLLTTMGCLPSSVRSADMYPCTLAHLQTGSALLAIRIGGPVSTTTRVCRFVVMEDN